MRRLLAIALSSLLYGGALAGVAAAKGWEMPSRDGVAVPGSAHRYIAISPGRPGSVTVVVRVDRQGGRPDWWWALRGDYHVPTVASDGAAGGLSADGDTLVLSRSSFQYLHPPRTTKLAILDTRRSQRPANPNGARPPASARAVTFVTLHGHFSFDAISPDGSTVYLTENLSRSVEFADYRLRALDVGTGRLLPRPIVDPDEPSERMVGHPLSRAASPDGRWAYTLYDGIAEAPFIHALDTVRGRAVRIDLPQLAALRSRFYYLLHLRTREGGRELAVMRHRVGPRSARQLLAVDTATWEVARPRGRDAEEGAGVAWGPIGAVSLLALLAIAWVAGRGRRAAGAAPARPA